MPPRGRPLPSSSTGSPASTGERQTSARRNAAKRCAAGARTGPVPGTGMTPERLRQIEELFHAVRERSAEERSALLARVDAELRREVESLLARRSNDLLQDRPGFDASARLSDDPHSSMPSAGTLFGP